MPGLIFKEVYYQTEQHVVAKVLHERQICLLRYFDLSPSESQPVSHDVEQLRLRYEFAIKNLPMHLMMPLKVVFERDPVPFLVLIEAFSQPVMTLNYFTAEAARNLLV